MPRKCYAIDRDGPRRLEIAWENPWRDLTIRFDEQLVGAIATREELHAGRKFALPDKSTLHVQLVKRPIDRELHVLRNGRPVPGSYTDPEARYKLAYRVTLGIMGLYVGLGLISILIRSAFLQGLGVGAHSLALGAALVLIAFYVKRRSAVALGVASVILLADGLLAAAYAILAGRAPAVLGLAFRGVLVFPLLDGIRAIREMDSAEEPF